MDDRPEYQPAEEESLELPVDGILDLHTFRPADVKDVVFAYIEACREKDIHELRIIHGKGIGTLRKQVQAILREHDQVQGFGTAPIEAGGWGATLVRLKRN